MCRENFRRRLSSKGEGSRQAETIANFPDNLGCVKKLETPHPIYSIYTRLYQTNFHDFSFSSLVIKICYEVEEKFILVWIFNDKRNQHLALGIYCTSFKVGSDPFNEFC